jgi:hypothetical protein
MPTLSELLLTNPHGFGTAPPAIQYDGDITNALDPRADYIGQKFGPEAGALAQKLLNAGVYVRDTAKGVAKGLSGIGMAEDAGTNLAHAVERGDPLAGAASVAQAGLAAMPAAGRLAEPLMATTPRLASVLLAGGVAPAVAAGALAPTEAEAKTRKPKAAPTPDPAPALPGLTDAQNARLAILQKKVQNSDWQSGTERRAIIGELQQLQNLSADYQKNSNAASVKAAEIEATAKAQREADAAAAEQARKEQEIAANTPFKKEHPVLSSGIPVVSATLAAILGSKIKGNYVKSFQKKIDDLAENWGNTTAAAENALKNGDTLTASRLSNEAQEMKSQFDSLANKGPDGSMAALLAGGATGEFGQIIPLASDYFKALPGSDLEKETKAQMTDPVGIAGRIANGLLFGGLPAKITSAYEGSKVSIPNGAAAKTTSLSALLKEGGTSEATAAQKALGDYGSAVRDREAAVASAGQRNQQLDSGAALVGEAAGDAPLSLPAPSSAAPTPHHSLFQPKDKKTGRFKPGKPKVPENDNN